MIIGTAGHIDHGKTALVKALTGVDADRLKEEKARGITIDLGFAYKRAGDDVLAFVDVPGHEKLIRNMLAGATGIDYVVLVVAADDGPMPQTREHLAILDLLGLARGVVALTKCDLVSAARLDEATAEVRSLLAGTALAGADIVAVSSLTGAGIAELDDHLRAARAAVPAPSERGNFRLAVDRCFTLAGFGIVVTGTAVSGSVRVGDKLLVSPRGLPVRVRGIHAQNRQAERGRAGERCALNLAGAGVEKSAIERGDWIVGEAACAPTQRFDARLKVLAAEARPLAHWTAVRLHLGACDVGARVVALQDQAIAPGSSALAQLELDRPIGALRGDRFIVRDQSAQRTLGGGVVIDPFASARGRRSAERLAVLAALEEPTAERALKRLLDLELPGGIDVRRFAIAWNLTADEQRDLAHAVPHRSVESGALRLAFLPGQLDRFAARVASVLAAHHKRAPDSPGLAVDPLRRAVAPKLRADVFGLLLAELTSEGSVRRSGPYLRLAGHEVALLPAEQKLWERLRPWLDEAGLHPPKLADLLARDRQLKRDQVVALLRKLSRMGKLYAVGNDYFVPARTMGELAARAQTLAELDPHRRLNVKALRESTGMSRHLSLPLVEFFDHIGFTKRFGDGRHIRRAAEQVFGECAARMPR